MNADAFDFPEDHIPRRGRLMASGILLALLGCLFGFFAAISIFALVMFQSFSTSMPSPDADNLKGMQGFVTKIYGLSGGFYGTIAVVLITVGFGSIFLKRWSRPLALILGWTWLYTGVMSLTNLLAMSGSIKSMVANPAFAGGPAASAAPPPPGMDGIFAVMMIVYVTLIFLFGILLPALVVWLNWHRDVKVTLDFCDRKPRWTDGCPVPVLGLVIWAAFAALSCLFVLWFAWVPVFGRVLTGPSGQIAMLVLGVVLAVLAWGLYRRSILAWGATLVLMIVGAVSSVMTFRDFDPRGLYEAMGMPQEMLDQMFAEGSPVLAMFENPTPMIVLMLVGLVPVLAFVGWTGRFFLSGQGREHPSPS